MKEEEDGAIERGTRLGKQVNKEKNKKGKIIMEGEADEKQEQMKKKVGESLEKGQGEERNNAEGRLINETSA